MRATTIETVAASPRALCARDRDHTSHDQPSMEDSLGRHVMASVDTSVSLPGDRVVRQQRHHGDEDATNGSPYELDREVNCVELSGEDCDPGGEDGAS